MSKTPFHARPTQMHCQITWGEGFLWSFQSYVWKVGIIFLLKTYRLSFPISALGGAFNDLFCDKPLSSTMDPVRSRLENPSRSGCQMWLCGHLPGGGPTGAQSIRLKTEGVPFLSCRGFPISSLPSSWWAPKPICKHLRRTGLLDCLFFGLFFPIKNKKPAF